jgi:hypothetical protein
MSRDRKRQADHDKRVRKVAIAYLKKGYKILADLPNWEQPDTIKGVRPGLSVRRKGHENLIEIETPESIESARNEKQKKVSNGPGSHTSFHRPRWAS